MKKRVRAVLFYGRISPRKARLVANYIKGKQVDEALNILQLLPKKGARMLEKVVLSAIANAENNHDMERSKLYISEARVENGPILYRYRPRAYGRAYRIRKRTAHVKVFLEEKE